MKVINTSATTFGHYFKITPEAKSSLEKSIKDAKIDAPEKIQELKKKVDFFAKLKQTENPIDSVGLEVVGPSAKLVIRDTGIPTQDKKIRRTYEGVKELRYDSCSGDYYSGCLRFNTIWRGDTFADKKYGKDTWITIPIMDKLKNTALNVAKECEKTHDHMKKSAIFAEFLNKLRTEEMTPNARAKYEANGILEKLKSL